MSNAILVPQVGQDLTEAVVVEINVRPGDVVKKGDIVAVVESEKASFDVEAFVSGTVLEVRYAAGDKAEVLAPLMLVGEAGEAAVQAGAQTDASADETAAEQTRTRPLELATVSGAAPVAEARSPGGVLRASPVARRMAAARGIALDTIAGTGPQGAVVMRDIAHLAAPSVLPASGAEGIGLVTLREGKGDPVVFLHGFGADLSSWRAFVGRVEVDSPLLALDLPGHGASSGVAAASFDALVEAVATVLRARGPHHLVGHSLGAAVGAALAARSDTQVRSLTLLAPAGLGTRIDGAFVDGYLEARSEAGLAAWMQRLVYRPDALNGALVRATLAAREARPDLVAAQRAVAKAVFEGNAQLFSVRPALESFEGPCRIVLGREDSILVPAEVEAAIPGLVALHRLERVGHLPHVEAAELTARLTAQTVKAAG